MTTAAFSAFLHQTGSTALQDAVSKTMDPREVSCVSLINQDQILKPFFD